MGKLRFFIAMAVAKILRLGLKILGRNATYLPGKAALVICKDFLGYLKKPETFIAVTGTNGKTTVSNLLTSILTENGYDVINNSYGSNVQAGITTALLSESSFFGKPKKKIAVLEVDERSSLLVYPYIQPDYLICNNIMRDSLKRNAHTEFISYFLTKAIPEKTKLFLNGDDIICSNLAPQCKDRTYFGMEAMKPEKTDSQHVRDIYYCPVCGEKLEADYLRYNHIGRVHCSKCSFKSPDCDYLVTDINKENNTFTISSNDNDESFYLINDNIVNVYNFCGVVALLSKFGLTPKQIAKGFSESKIVKTRYDSIKSGDLSITMQLAKGQNPIACARCYSYVAKCDGKNKSVVILVDDKGDNINNSESTCWLYDCDYSFLNDESISEVIFAGPRCLDQYLRARIAGINPTKIKTVSAPEKGAELVNTKLCKDIYVLYDPYLLAEADTVKKALIKKGEEEQ